MLHNVIVSSKVEQSIFIRNRVSLAATVLAPVTIDYEDLSPIVEDRV
jgi:hypothetical protein